MQAKSRTLLFILVSFLLGGLAGVFVDRTFLEKPSRSKWSKTGVMEEFTEKINLRPDQAAEVDSLLESHSAKFNEIRKGYSDTMKMQRDTLRKSIRARLSEEQNILFDQYVREMDERESKHRKESRQ